MPPSVKPIIGFKFSSETNAGFIYGIVTSMAVIAALADADANVIYMALAAFGTSAALALTFVYSHWLAGSYAGSADHAGGRAAFIFELPTLAGPFVLGLVMVVERELGLDVVTAAEATMWFGTFMLFILGYRIALQAGRSFRSAALFGLIDALIGALIVLVKVLAH